MKYITRYQAWENQIGGPQHTNRGSFFTRLFEAYRVADQINKNKLKKMFPEEFIITPVLVLVESLN